MKRGNHVGLVKIYYEPDWVGRSNVVNCKLFYSEYDRDLNFSMVNPLHICHKITGLGAFCDEFNTYDKICGFYSFINVLDRGLLALTNQSTLLLK